MKDLNEKELKGIDGGVGPGLGAFAGAGSGAGLGTFAGAGAETYLGPGLGA
jgi:lactobin A/cerein 7B family class IIb bacteriocin